MKYDPNLLSPFTRYEIWVANRDLDFEGNENR